MRPTFAVTVRVLRALRGGLPSAEAAGDELEAYALQARAQLEDIAARLRHPRGATVTEADGAPVRCLWVVDDEARSNLPAGERSRDELEAIDPIASTERIVLYLHGGAYCIGSPELFRGLAGSLSRSARAAVLLPDYALAPEHPFPSALDDVVAVWDWLTRERGVAPERIALGGDSAGGGLAASLCLRLRETGRGRPACLAAISPWTDLAATGGSLVTNERSDIWIPGELIPLVAQAYTGNHPLDDPLVSPLYGDLKALPPTLVHVSTDEVLLDDAERFVAAARAAGVDASLGRFEGLWHVFHAFPGFPESRSALQEIGAFVRRHTTPVEQQLAA